MLNEFEEEQKIAYRILKNEIENSKTSHAYLIETNGYDKSDQFVLSFAKALLCPYNYFNSMKCVDCTQCKNIDKNLFIELKIINPDGMWIKKEQTDMLQKDFLTKGVESDKRVYIINEADKLNSSSANSLLKFIEEPAENIIAILVTSNVYKVISTIRSRCQIISLKKTFLDDRTQLINKLGITEEEYLLYKNRISKFAFSIEQSKCDTILSINSLWNEFNNTREEFINSFDMLINYYQDVINSKINRKLIFYTKDDINQIFNNMKISEIIKKINIAKCAKDDIIANGNLNLIMDKLIIDLSGGKQ